MQLQDIDHIEFYVGDARQAAYFYCSAYGFRLVAQAGPETGVRDRRSLLLEQGKARLVLTSALSPEHPSAEYVKQHGDGARDIAFSTPDAAGAFREAVSRGARPVLEPTRYESNEGSLIQATVATTGDVVHSFIQREAPASAFVPGLFQRLDPLPPPTVETFSALDHVAFCLAPGTLNPTAEFYERVLGFHKAHEENIATEYSGMNSKVVQNDSGRICFPMQEPAPNRRGGQLDDFLTAHRGSGVQHVALLTSNIVAALQTLRSRNIEFLKTPSAYYDALPQRVGTIQEKIEDLRALDILVDRDPWGYLLQIFARSVHSRGTFFLEVIQRRDARGFGGANIKALYEAIERSRAGADRPRAEAPPPAAPREPPRG